MDGPKRLLKVQDQLANAEEVTQATLKSAEKGQVFHDAIADCVVGYTHWPALSNTGFGSMPELLRGKINTRVQEHRDLRQFWISTNEGRDLQNHAIENAITILVSPSTLDMNSLSFDTRNLKPVVFQPEWQGLLENNCTVDQQEKLPILANGGHRLDLLRNFPYQEKIKALQLIEEEIAKIDDKRKGVRSRPVLVAELGKLREELQGITWVAKILNKDKIEAHPHAKLIKLELASNKTHFQIEEKVQNSFSLLFDALNAQPGMTEENMQTVMRAAIESSDAKGKRMIQALSSLHLTYAYSRLCYNPYFRKDMPFSLAALKRWRRAAGAYTTSYTNWMALIFEYIFSQHELTHLPDITDNYQTYFGHADANDVFKSVTKNLRDFDKLDFSAKQVRLDLLDDDLYSLLVKASNMIKNQLDLFGHDHDDMTGEMSNQYDELYDQYTQVLYTGIDNWLAMVIPRHSNDPIATSILEQLKNKCLWITEGQLGSSYFFPAYDTPHPIVTAEFIISISDLMVEHEETMVLFAAQFEPLAQLYLAPTYYQAGTPTLYSVLWEVQLDKYQSTSVYLIRRAINTWLAALFRFRLSGLEDIRRIHADTNAKGLNQPPYLLDTPKFSGAPRDDPILKGMDKIVALLTALVDEENSDAIDKLYKEMSESSDDDFVTTSGSLLKQVIEKTHYTWKTKDIMKGSKNRTNTLRKLSRYFWIATHAPYALGEEDEGWDAIYFKKERIAHILKKMKGWTPWFELGLVEDDEESDDENGLAARFAEDITSHRSMRSLDVQIDGANHALQTMHDIFMKNPIFHCIVVDPETQDDVKTLKKPVARVLQNLFEVCNEELGHTAKYLLQDEYDYDQELSAENHTMIHDRLLELHTDVITPSHKDLADWHSPENMDHLNKTEHHANPDILRLENARKKRSMLAQKKPTGEKSLRRLAGLAGKKRVGKGKSLPASKKQVSSSQQAADEALIDRIEGNDAEQGKGKQKAISQDVDNEEAASESDAHEDNEDESSQLPPGNQQQQQVASSSKQGGQAGADNKRRLSDASNDSDRTTAPKKQKKGSEAEGRILVPSSSEPQGSTLDSDMENAPDAI
ncbi:hypothetical protein C0992_012211 [Termitomyces sp. T32_za158]|nr:hypothetical protein C0992_012211 [Termitomyces sp. T32_za158]